MIFYPRMVPGGYIFAYDCNSFESECAGSRALDHFLGDKLEKLIELPDPRISVVFHELSTQIRQLKSYPWDNFSTAPKGSCTWRRSYLLIRRALAIGLGRILKRQSFLGRRGGTPFAAGPLHPNRPPMGFASCHAVRAFASTTC
jgi:hypothetical protein